MTTDARKHGRQMRLAEVGERGQHAIAAARLPVRASTPAARRVARAYLEGAGATCEADAASAPAEVEALLRSLELEHTAARDVAEGAASALCAIRDVLRPR